MNTYTILVEVAIKIEANSRLHALTRFGNMDWSLKAPDGSAADYNFVDYYVVDDDEEKPKFEEPLQLGVWGSPEHLDAVRAANLLMTTPPMVEGFIDDVAISHVTVRISKEVSSIAALDLGSVTLNCEGREYKLDVTDSLWDSDEGYTEISCGLTTIDEDDIFEDCKFDLTGDDLFSSELRGTIFVGDEGEEIEGEEMTATLIVQRDGCTRAIDLTFE